MNKKTVKDDKTYEVAYGALNTAQKQAVDTIEGPVMVIAGPGTGKTQILTLRIANILKQTQMGPNNILALTFTDAGAKAMRQRLHRYIGAESYQVAIYTFHGLAERLIRDYGESYTRVVGGRPASDLDKITIIEEILDDPQFKLLRPIGNPLLYVRPILSIIAALKKEYITPDRLASILVQEEEILLSIERFHTKGAHKGKERGEYTKQKKSLQKNRELSLVYRLYESILSGKRLYDFEDMIIETIEALESNDDMLRDLQETYQYVLADEHQDVNGSQNRLIELLCNFHDQPNIFVVGDEKQSIYRFQGASLENFLYFDELFKKTKQINLTANYRSGQTILDAAHSLVATEDGPLARLRIPLQASRVELSSVEKRAFSHQAIEDTWVVKKISSLIKEGTPASEVAVIFRTNREVEQFVTLLRKEGIPAEASAEGDILGHPITHTIQVFIDAIIHSQNEEALFSLLHGPYWGICANDVIRITASRSYKDSLWSILSDRDRLKELGVRNVEEVLNIVSTLEEARKQQVTRPPHRVLETVLKKSGFLDLVLTSDAVEGSRVVRRIYDEIEKMVLHDKKTTLKEVSQVFSLYKEHHISLHAPYISSNLEAVQVMTAHKSKGLEFGAVFVPHLVDSVWGGATKREMFHISLPGHVKGFKADVIDDELRLLYVAMTRAKENLYLSNSAKNIESKEMVPSRLFDYIDPDYIIDCDTSADEENFSPVETLTKDVQKINIDKNLLRTFLEERGLSVTALNNYLQSPYNYLYSNVLHIPEAKSLSMQFGTAMHGVLESIFTTLGSTGKLPSHDEVKKFLEGELSRLPITETEFVQLHEKGFLALVSYVGHLTAKPLSESKNEFSVQVKLPTGILDFPEVILGGKLDRIDFDSEGRVVRVIDYKTGKPKTRNEIEGKTKDSTGGYKRQLVFYALMLSLYEDERYDCREGVLSFVEPDSKGVIHEEVFTITDEEIEELKSTIIGVVKQIITGSFLAEACDDKTSSYCHLAKMLED